MSQVQVAQNIREALQIQIRVIWALMLRETKTMYGRSKFGYLWVVIQTVFGIFVFWGIRAAMHSPDPYGLPLPIFLLCGMTGWSVFSDCVQKIAMAVDANQALLYYSKVRHFDIMVARALLVGATNAFVFIILMSVIYLAGFNVVFSSLWPFILSWFFLMVMGTGLGALCCALKRYIDSIIVLVSMLLRVMFFMSGVIFSYNQIPGSYRFIGDFNPVFQLVEYSRVSFSYVYPCTFINMDLVMLTSLVILTLGLTVELSTRGKVDVV